MNGVEVNDGVVGDNSPEENEIGFDMNDGKVNDVEFTNFKVYVIGIFGAKTDDESDDVRFHYDGALNVVFDDSDEGSGSDGLV